MSYKIISHATILKEITHIMSQNKSPFFHYKLQVEFTDLINKSTHIPNSKLQAVVGELYFDELVFSLKHAISDQNERISLLQHIIRHKNHFIYLYQHHVSNQYFANSSQTSIKKLIKAHLKEYQQCIEQLQSRLLSTRPNSIIIEEALEHYLGTIHSEAKNNPAIYQEYQANINMYLFQHFASFCITNVCTINDMLATYDRFMFTATL